MTRRMRSSLLAMASLLLVAQTVYAESRTYDIDPTHTYVTYEVRHFGTSTSRGRFNKTSGTITVDPTTQTGRAEVNIDINSIDTGLDNFNQHLKKDYFDASTYPTAKFVGEKFSFDGEKVTEVSGQLTLHGQTRPVTLKATHYNCYQNPFFKRQVCGGDFETTINRSQFGIHTHLPLVPDAVHLLIQLEAAIQPTANASIKTQP